MKQIPESYTMPLQSIYTDFCLTLSLVYQSVWFQSHHIDPMESEIFVLEVRCRDVYGFEYLANVRFLFSVQFLGRIFSFDPPKSSINEILSDYYK